MTTEPADNDDPKGFAQMPRWLQRSEDATGPAKLVYLALSSRANKYGQSTPSHGRLAREASCSVATVKRALEELRDVHKVVSWETRRRGAQGMTSNVYTIGIAARLPNVSDPSNGAVAQTELHPVDNPEGVAHPELGGSSHRATNEREPFNDLTQSSRSTHHGGAVDNHDDDDRRNRRSNYPTPGDVAKTQTLNLRELADQVSDILGDFDLDHDQLAVIATEILGKASEPVLHPTAYVAKAIRTKPWVHQSRALEFTQKRIEAGGNLF